MTSISRGSFRPWAWIRLEGVLLQGETVSDLSFLTTQGATLADKARGWIHRAALQTSPGDRERALRLACAGFRGFSEDRLFVLAEELAERLEKRICDETVAEIRRMRREHGQIGLLAYTPSIFVEALRSELPRFDAIVAPSFEFQNGRATGRLIGDLPMGPSSITAVSAALSNKAASVGDCTVLGRAPHDLALLGASGAAVLASRQQAERDSARAAGWEVHPHVD